ncbi:MAG TPA: ABC transporter permease [Bryobacteraceae bacterium]|nr:ABC transporter permease [Bryobacteraceae bacterium]
MPFFWNRREAELRNEFAHHLHHLRAEYERQGYSREEAERMARREFGAIARTEEQCRDERRWAWMTGLRQDIVYGVRMMRRTPAVTLAAVLSLALGIGANTAVVSLMDLVLWRDLPVPNPQQLTLVHWQGHGFPRDLTDGASGSMDKAGAWDVADFFSYAAYREMRRSAARLASVAAYSFADDVSITFAGRPMVAKAQPVSGNFLSTLEVRPQVGRLLSDSDDVSGAPAVVVLSHRFWAHVLGSDPSVVGRPITIDNELFVIAGVLEPAFYGLAPGDDTDLYTALHHAAFLHSRFQLGREIFENNRYWGLQLLARRASGVSAAHLLPAVDTAFRASWAQQPKNGATAPRIRLDEGRRGLDFLRDQFRNSLLVLGGLVTLLLAIACVNVANLLLARAVARSSELAMRISLGCSRARLLRQLLTESALLAVIGGALSIAVAWLTATLLGGFLAGDRTVPIGFILDARTTGIAAAVTISALMVFGLFPAWHSSRRLDASWLQQRAGSTGLLARRGWSSGQIFAVFQMALSVVLVMTAVIFTRNLMAIQSSDPGFDRRNLILFNVRPGTSGYDKARLTPFYFNLEQRLASVPGVSGVGLASMRPMNIGGWWQEVRLSGRQDHYPVSANGISPSYLDLYTRRLVAGRNFTRADEREKSTVAIISEDLARKLGGDRVLGRTIAMADGPPGAKLPEYEVIGIAPVIAATSIKERPYALWLPFWPAGAQEATVVLRTSAPPRAVLPGIQKAMSEIDRNLPMVDTMTMEEQISKGLQRERMFATLCNAFGTLALVLSVVGLYGVVSYGASRRRADIGVRLALGARPGNVIAMILRQGLAMAVPGVLLGVPVVWLGGKYLQKELTNMKPVDPTTLLLAPGILLLAAVLATLFPAVRASALDPAETLRQE